MKLSRLFMLYNYTIFAFLIVIIASWIFLPRLIESAYNSTSWPFFNNIISGQAYHPLDHYLSFVYRSLIFYSVIIILLLACFHNSVRSKIYRFIFYFFTHFISPRWLIPVLLIFFITLPISLWLLIYFQFISHPDGASYITFIGFLLTSILVLSQSLQVKQPLSVFLNSDYQFTNPSSKLAVSTKHVLFFFIILIAFILATRLQTYGEAYERDLMVYMAISERLLDGWPLYSVLWDHKPPGIHLTYMSFIAVFGTNPLSMFFLGITAFFITLLGCYIAAKEISGKAGGLLAAGVWAIASGDLLLQANQPNVEVFINACLIWGVALILLNASAFSVKRYVAIGFLFFLSTFYKTVAVTVPALVLIAHLLYPIIFFRKQTGQSKYSFFTVLYQFVFSVVTAIFCWLIVFMIFFVIGDFNDFKFAVFDYNREYAGNLFVNIVMSLSPISHSKWFMPYALIFIMGFSYSLYSCLFSFNRNMLIVLAYFIGAWLAFALPGKFYPHYYQLLFPPTAIAVGCLGSKVIATRDKSLRLLYFYFLLLPLVVRIYQSFIPLDVVPVVKYGTHGYQSLETKNMAEWINASYNEDSTVYHWGGEPGLYFWSQRPSLTGFVYNFVLKKNFESARHYSRKELKRLTKIMPDLIVANKKELKNVDHPIEEWIIACYKPISGPTNIKHFVFLVPK